MIALRDIPLPELLRAVETQYGLKLTSPPRALPSGVHSVAWVVTSARGAWVVKVSDPTSDPVDKLERHVRLYSFLDQHGIAAPQILPLSDHRFVGTFTTNRANYLVQLMKYEDPRRVSLDGSAATLHVVGELVARLHQALAQYPERDVVIADRRKSANEWGVQNQGVWELLHDLPDLARLAQTDQARLQAVDRRAVAYIQQHYPDPANVTLAVLHGDLNFGHIQLADGSPYVFDFGDMSWGPVAHELAVFLQTVFRDSLLSFAQWEALRRHILHGYTAQQPLAQHDRALIDVFIVNRIVAQARYMVELAGEGLTMNWQVLKRTYALAEYLLNK